jgi:hypothetical protein
MPWTGFDFINVFNAWKKTEHAGRVFTVDGTGEAAAVEVTGLAWRGEVCQRKALARTLMRVQPARETWEPTFKQRPLPEPTTPAKGGAQQPTEVVRHALGTLHNASDGPAREEPAQ